MAKSRFVLNSAGVAELLKSSEVQADLASRAGAIADAAGEGFEASSYAGAHRARASVITATFEAMLEEAKNRTLTRAIDAGR
jgi:hypothetical protein